MSEMSTPTSTPGPNDDPAEHRDEPIDPTRTFDTYFDKQDPDPTTPVEGAPDSDDQGPSFTKSTDSEPTPSEPAYDEPIDDEPTDDESASTETAYTPAYAESSHTYPGYGQSPYSQTVYPDPTRTDLTTAPPIGETVSPAGFSLPPTQTTPTTQTAPTMSDTTYTPAEPTEPRAVRMRTVVFGLVLLVIAGAVLVGQLTDITVNAGAVLLALMIGGGVLLIAGARRS
jgi:hypothetical protein